MGNKNSGIKPKNITGKRFGKLTVSNYAGNSRWATVKEQSSNKHNVKKGVVV